MTDHIINCHHKKGVEITFLEKLGNKYLKDITIIYKRYK